MLIIVCGLPGSGKTSLAKAIAKRYKAEHISSDLMRKRMFQKPEYTDEEKERVYEGMAQRAGQVLLEKKSAVVDATFYKAKERARFLAVASEAHADSFIILCTLPEEEIRKRLSRRKKGSMSDADFSVYLKLKDRFEPLSGDFLMVDTSAPVKDRVMLVAEFIGI